MKSFIIPSAMMLSAMASVCSHSVAASDSFKLAVIEGSKASGKILEGDYQQSVQHLALGKQSETQVFETAMSWCVAKVKLKQLKDAQYWCDKAVQLVETDQSYRTKTAKFKSLALNNRAIVKYLQDDNHGAYQDFSHALSLHKSAMVRSNQQQFAHQFLVQTLKQN